MAINLGNIYSGVRKGLIGLNGRVTRSKFYLSNLASGEQLELCATPEAIKYRSASNFRSWQIINVGEVKLPK